MAKVEMHKQLVLLRHVVRRARVCTVHKLTKEAKLLQKKYGDEAQQEKYRKKANKLITEICVLKRIKDNDISRFAIMNEREPIEILQDQSSSDSDRIMARIMRHKAFCEEVKQFKEKFPDCKVYLTKNKNVSRKRSKAAKIKDASKQDNLRKEDKNTRKQKILVDENSQCSDEEEDETNAELSEVKDVSCEHGKSLNSTLERNGKLTETKENDAKVDENHDEVDIQPDVTKLCNVTKETTIKRFTQLLEQDSDNDVVRMPAENEDLTSSAVMRAKTEDDFFVTGGSRENYKGGAYVSLTSEIKSQKRDERIKAFPSNDRFTKRHAKFRTDTKFNKSHRYNEFKHEPSVNNSSWDKKYLDKKTFTKTKKREPNAINKNNLHGIKNTENDVTLHPSWLAKKKQQSVTNQGFQGKKIVFDFD